MSLAKWFPFKFNRKSKKEEQSSAVPVQTPDAEQGTALAPFGPNPFELMREMLNDPFSADPFGGFGKLERWFGDHSPHRFQPRVDVVDRGQSIEVTAELAGLTKDDVKISVTEEALTLSGEKRIESESKEDGCYRVERAYGSFRRVLPLPKEVDRDQVDATFKDGVLKISLPKTKASLPARRVAVH
jgi:HSP20 family protein